MGNRFSVNRNFNEIGHSTNFLHHFQQEADLALADLSVTPQRSQAVDFSVPFQTFASTIVTKVRPKSFSLVGQ